MKQSLPIRKIRKSLNLSAAQVGQIIGVGERAIQHKEIGQRPFTGIELLKIRDHFKLVSGKDFSIEELLVAPLQANSNEHRKAA